MSGPVDNAGGAPSQAPSPGAGGPGVRPHVVRGAPAGAPSQGSAILAAVLKLGSAACGLGAALLFILPAVRGQFSAQPRMLTLTPSFEAEAPPPSRPAPPARPALASREPVSEAPTPPEPVAPELDVRVSRVAFDGAILVMESEPSGASAWVNGREQGQTPLSMGLDCVAGMPLSVEFALRGHERVRHTVPCPEDTMLKVSARLRKTAKAASRGK
ncbi:PEGA domain-containing protein [Myxococcaceae bacterium GXIMD 01537]